MHFDPVLVWGDLSVPTVESHRAASVAPLWVLAGACWTVQLFLPWTSRGAFSSSSMLDGVSLIRSGAVDAVVPGWAAYVLLALPAIGLAMTALAGLGGAAAGLGRVTLAVGGAAAVAAAGHLLVGYQPSRTGPGGWVSAAGALLAVAAVLTSVRGRRLEEHPS